MTKIKIALILLSCILRVLTETTSSKAQEKIDNLLSVPTGSTLPHTQVTRAYPPPKEEPSFMSKVASWIFPFGGTSETAADSTPSETQQRYAPQYLPAPQHDHYKQPCNPCNREPWIPVAGTHGRDTVIGFVQQPPLGNQGHFPPSNAYGPPPSSLQDFHPPPLIQHAPQISNQYGAPPLQQQHISAPIQSQYGIPKEHYGAPTNIKPVFDQPPDNFRTPVQHFIPPPLPKQAIPLFKNVGLPTPKLNPPKQVFPPSKHGVLKSGPYKFKPNSPPQHGPPIPLNYGKPHSDKYKFSASPTATKSPLLNIGFKAPSPNSHPVKGYTITQGVLLQPPPFNVDYIAQIPNYQIPSSGGILGNQQLSPIFSTNYDIPSSQISSGNVEQNLLGSSKYNYPISNFAQSNNGVNNPITGQTHQHAGSQHNSQSFQTGVSPTFGNPSQHGSNTKLQANNEQVVHDVQVIPSIRVADYLASIEHPINVIQSPLVDVIATENFPLKEIEPTSNYVNNKVQLSENPIVVDTHDDDTHAAATAQNLSYYNPTQNEKRNNDNYVETSFRLHNQNLDNNKDSSSHETLNSSFSDVNLRTVLPSQNPTASAEFNVNLTQYFSSNEYQSQNENEPSIYKEIANQPLFTQPPMDYSNWTPSFGTLSTSIVPPPLGEPVWNAALTSKPVTTTTKKPKHVQIIIPYISNNPSSGTHSNSNLYNKNNVNIRNSKEQQTNSAGYSTPSLSLYTQPPTDQEPVWSHYVTNYNYGTPSKTVTSTEKSVLSTKKSVSNIRDLLLKEEKINNNFNKLPFDIISLQKNIDDWTEQEFSNGIIRTQKASTTGKLVPSKKIPTAYLTTQPYNRNPNEVTTVSSIQEILYDHEPAGSNTKLSKVESNEDIDTNFILTETTPFLTPTTDAITTFVPPIQIRNSQASINSTTSIAAEITTTEASPKDTLLATPGLKVTPSVVTPKPMWEQLQVSISPQTKEKVYVVTPQPWKIIPKEINEKLLLVTESSNAALTSAKFTVVIQSEGDKRSKELTKDKNGGLHVVYSEWPHLINNLQTTTSTTEKPKATNHPLFGLMDLFSYMPPPNSTVETYGGHSKVITVVTPTSVTKKISAATEKTTTRTTPLAVG